jgi:hypothetical protein
LLETDRRRPHFFFELRIGFDRDGTLERREFPEDAPAATERDVAEALEGEVADPPAQSFLRVT